MLQSNKMFIFARICMLLAMLPLVTGASGFLVRCSHDTEDSHIEFMHTNHGYDDHGHHHHHHKHDTHDHSHHEEHNDCKHEHQSVAVEIDRPGQSNQIDNQMMVVAKFDSLMTLTNDTIIHDPIDHHALEPLNHTHCKTVRLLL